MARGIPAAVARAGSLPEITDGAALTFDPDDPAELATRVLQIATDSSVRSSLIAHGIKTAGRYRWAAAAEAIWTMARETAARDGRSP